MDLITQLSREHEEVFEEAIILKSSASMLKDAIKASSGLKNLESFFQRGVLPHFEFEEKNLFPLLLKSGSTEERQFVAALQDEHADMSKKIARFADLVLKYKSAPSSKSLKELSGLSRQIIEQLLSHARKEDKNFFPFLKKTGYKL